jgi:hypothetical protein
LLPLRAEHGDTSCFPQHSSADACQSVVVGLVKLVGRFSPAQTNIIGSTERFSKWCLSPRSAASASFDFHVPASFLDSFPEFLAVPGLPTGSD